MAGRPHRVAGMPVSVAEQPPGADPFRTYCPDLDQWSRSWAYEPRDIPTGLQLVKCFTPFLRDLLTQQLSRTTLRRHRDNIWVLGGEVIRRLQMDSALRRMPIEQIVLGLIEEEGGPLLSHRQSDDEQRSFDATCRRLFRFLTTQPTIGGRRGPRRHPQ